ncbi:MAG: DUF1206 domain-containing protein [Microlunatus sp.]|nr:DUF1206 domain-containing protein [Microlunatus sp.]MDN5769984.1 DUF1206 domain-containing protein [Microlunatus sp.]
MPSVELASRRGYQVLISVGLVSYGIVHLVLAWISAQVALSGGGGKNASSTGALKQLAEQPFGVVLLWVMAVGLLTLVLWQGLEAVGGKPGADPKDRVKDRSRAIGRAVVYLALAFTAGRIAVGAGSGSGDTEQTLTSRLMAAPFGRGLVVIVGLAVLAVGIAQIVKGVRRTFVEDDLAGGVARPVIVLGTTGWAAKGVALGLIGVLFGWAALSYDPEKAGGLDAALGTLRAQPFGPVLLLVMALGFAAFGLYCFAWARNAKS